MMSFSIKKCPACSSELITEITEVSFKASTNTTLKNNLDFKLSHCINCNNYFNSSFRSANINFKKPALETFFSHSGTKRSENKLLNILKTIFLQISFPDYFLDYGCGDGSFLVSFNKKFSQKKNIPSLGFDIGPSLPRSAEFTSNIQKLNEFLGKSNNFYFISSRHLLEHLHDVNLFFSQLSKLKNLLLYIEVPNGNQSILNGHFEDLHYDHVSYFSFLSLERMLINNNLIPISRGYLLNNENIYIIACRFGNKNLSSKSLFLSESKLILNYQTFTKKIISLRLLLQNETTVFWGVGGRALSLLNKAKVISKKELDCFLVDSDQKKIGIKIPGYKKNVMSINDINLKCISRIIIGSRVGSPYIKEEIYKLCPSPSFKIIDIAEIF